MFNYDDRVSQLSSPAWRLYDDLIAEVPEGLSIKDAFHGKHWNFVANEENVGLAHTFIQTCREDDIVDAQECVGKDLREAAKCFKSWNFERASYGNAALNSFFNTRKRAEHMNASFPKDKSEDAISMIMEKFQGKRIAIVGHFPKIEQFAELCDLYVLELNPRDPIDLFTSAAEFVLPSVDAFIMTGMTLANKTAPRLLELSKNAYTAMIGPSVPVSEVLFDHGVDMIGTSICTTTSEKLKETIANPGNSLFGNALTMITIKK
ncbi:MAG: DUF364 domain-containing protein [Coriobacteriia bacterium]|nr:DUF364 domain-containing protein [Coriobacteriia bacterium]